VIDTERNVKGREEDENQGDLGGSGANAGEKCTAPESEVLAVPATSERNATLSEIDFCLGPRQSYPHSISRARGTPVLVDLMRVRSGLGKHEVRTPTSGHFSVGSRVSTISPAMYEWTQPAPIDPRWGKHVVTAILTVAMVQVIMESGHLIYLPYTTHSLPIRYSPTRKILTISRTISPASQLHQSPAIPVPIHRSLSHPVLSCSGCP
jgi:hypothetical protein